MSARLAAPQKLDIAYDGASRSTCREGCGMRLRMEMRYPWTPNEKVGRRPVAALERPYANAGFGCYCAASGIVVPAGSKRARARERARSSQPRSREAHHRGCSALHAFGEDHRHLNFSVARPMTASTEAMIQNRMTMVGSCHPFRSK